MESAAALRLGAVHVWFAGGPRVLDDINLRIGPGEHWALLGPNGAGKSTLLGLAGALRHPSRGTVDVLGSRLGRVDLRQLRRRIGSVDVRLRMPAALTVLDYVLTGAEQTIQPSRDYPAEQRERAAALTRLVDLGDRADRPIGVCSQGERARARVARGLMPQPELLLLDEPAAGLDLPGRADLLDVVERLTTQPGLTSVSVAHHLEELPRTTTHVALLRAGRLIADGDADLLHDREALSACFGRPVRAFTADGRWYGSAQPR